MSSDNVNESQVVHTTLEAGEEEVFKEFESSQRNSEILSQINKCINKIINIKTAKSNVKSFDKHRHT